jgi:hypothetical protein
MRSKRGILTWALAFAGRMRGEAVGRCNPSSNTGADREDADTESRRRT